MEPCRTHGLSSIILKRGDAWSDLMICFDSELFPQNFVWQLNNDRKSLEPHRNCQIKSSKWLYFSFHMSQRIDNIQFYSYESIFPTNFKCSKHFALKNLSELWHVRPRFAALHYQPSSDHGPDRSQKIAKIWLSLNSHTSKTL